MKLELNGVLARSFDQCMCDRKRARWQLVRGGGGGAALPGLSRENGHPGGLIQAGRQRRLLRVSEGVWSVKSPPL